MQSKRKRAARCQEDTAQDLLQAFNESREVPRDGTFPMLRWLVRAQCIASCGAASSSCNFSLPHALNCANAMCGLPAQETLDALERQVVAALLVPAAEVPLAHLQCAATFFQWWASIVRITCMPVFPQWAAAHAGKGWLDPTSLERSLVVPDVRRAAIKIMQMLAIRPGEYEIAAEISGLKSKSCSSVLQTLRTGEWNCRLQQILMYGTLTDIYNAGMLDAVYFSIIDSRYVGRLKFQWVEHVLQAPGKVGMASSAPWPRIASHSKHYVLHWRGNHNVYTSAVKAYSAWVALCLQLGGVIGGRYDVRKCTI